jgi:predicted metal-dependent peptidase
MLSVQGLSINRTVSAEQRIQKCVVDIVGHDNYFALAGLLMIGDRTVNDETPTACTNGRDEWYGRAYVEQLNDPQLRFLVLHENYHKLFRHIETWQHLYKIDPRRANIACDYVVNIKIADDHPDGWAVMPEGGYCDPKYRGWDVGAVFWDMPNDGGDQPDGPGTGFDDHDWEGAEQLSDEEKHELARDIDEAVRQGALLAGKMGKSVGRSIEDLLKPQVDWREVLREFITSTCAGSDYSTWRRPNRRYISAGYYMPSGISERVEELVIAIDTSGSIQQRQLTMFLSEVKSVCETVRPQRVRLLYWDTQVSGDETYTTEKLDTLVKSTKPSGGGGTDIDCVPAYLTEHKINAQAAIVLTDGYLGGSWGKWSMPVLWCILDNPHAKPDCGKVVNIKGMEI